MDTQPANDTELACKTCGTSFTFTAAEATFYAAKGLLNVPKHCKVCREARKAAGTGAPPSGERHSATCSDCGQITTVPFVPDSSRPTYCPACYRKHRPKENTSAS